MRETKRVSAEIFLLNFRAIYDEPLMTIHPPEPSAPSDQDTHVPVSERVIGILSDRIRSGVYRAGDLLPTERTLAADLKVHRRSVRAAIDSLVQEGRVSRRPNCRPTVSQPSSNQTSSDQTSFETPGGLAAAETASRKPSRISASNLIALLMWHGGGPLEHAGSSQQRIFWGMNQSLMKLGYHAVFLDLGGQKIESEEENAAQEAVHLRYIRDQGFGGALFYPYGYRHNRDLVQEVSRTVPLVLLDRKIPGAESDFVGIENYGAMREITRHLVAQGHQRIAFLTNSEVIGSVQDRGQGYLDTVRSENNSGMMEIILHMPSYTAADRWAVVDAVFRLPKEQRPTAIACLNDYMAVDLAERLGYLGLSVPADVAVTGFDNIVPTLPNGLGLTTAAQPYEEIGMTSVDLLMRRIKNHQAPPVSVELPARLIVRGSSTA